MSLESRGDQRIRVRDIRGGGAIAKDGFIKVLLSPQQLLYIAQLLNLKFPLQPGFEVVEVDGKRLRGKSQSEATHLVAEAFNSTNQTMTLIVIPTK